MHPFFFDMLPAYGVMVATAVVVAWLWFQRRAHAAGLSVEKSSNVAFWTLLGGILGGKLGLLVVERSYYFAHPGEILSIEFLQAAGVVWTAVLGGLAGLVISTWLSRLPVGELLDAAAPTVPVGQAIGRIGCLLAGCCFGDFCHMPWAIRYGSEIAHARTGVHLHRGLHPTPIYELLWSLLAVLPLTLLAHRYRRRPGQAVAVYFAAYGVGRFVIEFFRGDVARGFWFGGTVSTSQLISLAIVPVALGVWLYLQLRPAKADATPGEGAPEGTTGLAPDAEAP